MFRSPTRIPAVAAFVLAPAMLAASLHLACTGSDPASVTTPAPTQMYGVFLTSTTFATNFGAATERADMAALVDALCAAHAADAGVARATDYRAIIAVGTNTNGGDVVNRLLVGATIDASAPSWCRLSAATPPEVRCDLGAIFTQPSDFTRGPRQNIFTDERGKLAPQTPFKGNPAFLSGFVVLEGQQATTEGKIRNCDQWHNELDAAIPPGTDTSNIGPEYGFGIGQAQAVTSDAGDLRWIGNDFAYCEPQAQFPILCIEIPR